MEIVFKFNTENEHFSPEELECYLRARSMASCLIDIQNLVREWYFNEVQVSTNEIHEEVWNLFDKHGLNMLTMKERKEE